MIVRGHKLSPRLVMFAAVGATSALNYAFGLAMGWLLAPGNYGLLAFAQTLLLLAGLIFQSGFSWSLAREVVRAEEPDERSALVRGALAANVAIAAVAGIVLVALFAAGPLRGGFERWPVAVIAALCLPFISVAATARGCAQGSDRFGTVAAIGLTEMSCKLLSGTALVLLGFGVSGAIAGFLIGACCSAGLGLSRLYRGFGVGLRRKIKLPEVRAAGAMFGALLGISMLLNLDLAGLKLLSPDRAAAGYYQAALMISNAPYYLVSAALLPVLFVQLARQNNLPATREVMGETLGLVVALVVPFEFVLMVVPGQVLTTFFPASYSQGAQTLRWLAVGNALLILTAIFSAAFQAVGRANVSALILLSATLAEPFALWAVVPAYGSVGAVLVFVAAVSLSALCLLGIYLHQTGIPEIGTVALWSLRYAAAVGAGLAAGRLAFEAGASVNLAVVSGAGCYLISAVLVRLIRPLQMLPGGEVLFRKLATSGRE